MGRTWTRRKRPIKLFFDHGVEIWNLNLKWRVDIGIKGDWPAAGTKQEVQRGRSNGPCFQKDKGGKESYKRVVPCTAVS